MAKAKFMADVAEKKVLGLNKTNVNAAVKLLGSGGLGVLRDTPSKRGVYDSSLVALALSPGTHPHLNAATNDVLKVRGMGELATISATSMSPCWHKGNAGIGDYFISKDDVVRGAGAAPSSIAIPKCIVHGLDWHQCTRDCHYGLFLP